MHFFRLLWYERLTHEEQKPYPNPIDLNGCFAVELSLAFCSSRLNPVAHSWQQSMAMGSDWYQLTIMSNKKCTAQLVFIFYSYFPMSQEDKERAFIV